MPSLECLFRVGRQTIDILKRLAQHVFWIYEKHCSTQVPILTQKHVYKHSPDRNKHLFVVVLPPLVFHMSLTVPSLLDLGNRTSFLTVTCIYRRYL